MRVRNRVIPKLIRVAVVSSAGFLADAYLVLTDAERPRIHAALCGRQTPDFKRVYLDLHQSRGNEATQPKPPKTKRGRSCGPPALNRSIENVNYACRHRDTKSRAEKREAWDRKVAKVGVPLFVPLRRLSGEARIDAENVKNGQFSQDFSYAKRNTLKSGEIAK